MIVAMGNTELEERGSTARVYKTYYPHGQIESYCKVEDPEEKNGKFKKWYPDGTLAEQQIFTDGKREYACWRDNGVPFESYIGGVFKKWHKNGQLGQESGRIDNGKSHGSFRKWYDDGSLYEETTCVNGIVHGTYRKWYKGGQLHTECQVDNGIIIGTLTTYNRDGTVKSVEHHEGASAIRIE